jgi:hypothetical protein
MRSKGAKAGRNKSESENEFCHEKEYEDSENIVAGCDERTRCNRRVYAILVEYQGYEGADKRSDDDHDDQGYRNGHADIRIIVKYSSQKKYEKGEYHPIDNTQPNFFDHSPSHAALDAIGRQTLYNNR